MKRAKLALQAERDVLDAFGYYFDIRVDLAARFTDAITKAQHHIERHPGTGSPRYAHLLGWPDLRFWVVDGFPYMLFYVEQAQHLDVIRVLHQNTDIASVLASP